MLVVTMMHISNGHNTISLYSFEKAAPLKGDAEKNSFNFSGMHDSYTV